MRNYLNIFFSDFLTILCMHKACNTQTKIVTYIVSVETECVYFWNNY